jgi:peptide/nickel transport system substrate-binding protein
MSSVTNRMQLLACVCLVTFIGAACGSSSAPTSKAGGGTLTLREYGDWGPTLDPARIQIGTAYGIVLSAYDTLVNTDSGQAPVPYLAESWNATASSITLTLHKNVSCSDGTPLTATAVANSLDHFATKSGFASGLLGPGPYHITANDSAGTVTFQLPAPNNQLLLAFGSPASAIVCPAGLAAGADLTTKSYGTGPYVLDSAVHGQGVTMHLRKEWTWGPRGATASRLPDQLVFKLVTDETTAANLVQSGGLDIANINGPDIKRLLSNRALSVVSQQSTTPNYWYFGEYPGHVTDDPQVRWAIMNTFDPKAYAIAATGGLSTTFPTAGIIGPNQNCFQPMTQYLPKHDPAVAKQILQADGYTPGSDGIMMKNGQPLTVNLLASVASGNGPDYLTAQFQAAGMKVILAKLDFAQWASRYVSGNFDVVLGPANSTGGKAPALSTLATFTGKTPSNGGQNYYNIQDPILDQLASQARSAAPGQECPYWNGIAKQLLAGYHYMPLDVTTVYWFRKPGLDYTFALNTQAIDPTSFHR